MRVTTFLLAACVAGASVASPIKRDEQTPFSGLSTIFSASVSGMQSGLTLDGILEDVASLVGLGNLVESLVDATSGLDAELDDLTNVTAIIDEIHTLQMELAHDLGLYNLLTTLGNDSEFFYYEAIFDHVVEALSVELKYFLGIKGGNGTQGLDGVVQALNSDVDTLLSELGVEQIDTALANIISSLVNTLTLGFANSNDISPPDVSNVKTMRSQTTAIVSAIAAGNSTKEITPLAKSLSATVQSMQASL